MKLKNKISGEVKEFVLFDGNELQGGATLESLTKEWEDVPEEPSKTIWQIKDSGELQNFEEDNISDGYIESSKSIGNYFSSREEAEKAKDKLLAWQRIKKDLVSLHWQDEKDGKFSVWGQFYGNMLANDAILNIHREDLDLLFPGGEE